MRVCLCSPRFFKSGAEGVSKTLSCIYKGLLKNGIEAEIIAPISSPQEANRGFSSLVKSLEFVRFSRDMLKGADIIHYFSPNPALAAPLKMISKSKKTTVICHVWNSYLEWRELRSMLRTSSLTRGLLREYVPHVLLNTKPTALVSLAGIKILTVSSKYTEHQINALRLNSKIHCIPNGVDVTDFTPVDATGKIEAKKSLGIPPDAEVILYYGHVNHMRGLIYLVEAMCEVIKHRPKIRLVVAESGLGTFHFRSLTDTFHISKRTTFLGVVDVKKLLAATDVGVLPFLSPLASVIFPSSLFEMMAAGVPVVGTKVGGFPEVIEHGKTGILVEPANSKQLSSALIQLLRDESFRARIGRQARIHVMERFDWKKIIKQLVTLYEKSLNT